MKDLGHLDHDTAISDGRLFGAALTAFALVGLLAGIDIMVDVAAGTTLRHVFIESVVFGLGLAGAIVASRRLRSLLQRAREARKNAAALAGRLAATEAEAVRWREETRLLLQGLSAAIDKQLERWGLSNAEKEVALLLLKGLSHKEIAGARAISEATARQQATAVYKKAGVAGRSNLAAFFLEELLLPGETR